MSCLCCFGNSRGDTMSRSSSKSPEGKEVYMDDLVLNPNRIDAKLESQMAEWQDAINDYQALEDICREEIEDELLPIIEDLRERPAHYKDRKYSANVQALAGKLIRANELQKRLESSRRDDDSSSLGSRIKYYLCFACSNNSTTRKSAMESTIRETVSMSNNLSISDKLSEKWAFRLNEINPTQGSSSVNAKSLQNTGLVKSDAPMDIKFKPKWPDFLIDTYFDVIKINMYGRKMRRIIKLTQHYVVNITNGSEISKFYAYREIRRVWLESGDTIVVVLKNGKQSVYMSHIAPHVLQQITTRVQVRRSLDKAEFHGPAFSLGYSAAVTAGIIKNISEENTLDSEAVVALFASELKDRTVRSLTGNGLDGTGSASGTNSKRSSNTSLPTLAEKSPTENGATNPLHNTSASASPSPASPKKESTKETPSIKKLEIIPPKPNFTTPFTNAINNKEERTESSASVDDTSDASFHTAAGLDTPIDSTSMQSQAALAAVTAAPRLLSFKEGMPEYYVQAAVQTLIFDATTSEGNTRKLFIDRFKSSCITGIGSTVRPSSAGISASRAKSSKPATLIEVRHFIDGMHEYILGNRGVSLSLLYEREKQRIMILTALPTPPPESPGRPTSQSNGSTSPSPAPAPSPGGRGIARTNSKRPLLGGANFQGPNTTAVADNELTSRASLQFLKDNNMDLSMIDEKIVIFISFIIFMVVEEAVFLPLKADLINLLPSSSKQEEEQLLLDKMKTLALRSQQQWGIPEELVSPLGWQTAIFELQGLEHNLTPSTQLHVLTRTVKAIYNEFKHVLLPQLTARGVSQSCIAADDLVPIFIYIFCRSGLKHPMRSRDLMWSLCHPDQLQGEGGYYLTVFESSIEFVLGEEITRDSFAFSYATTNVNNSISAADMASSEYVAALRRKSGGKSMSRSGSARVDSGSTSRSSGQYADALTGSVFDISTDFHDSGLRSNRSSNSSHNSAQSGADKNRSRHNSGNVSDRGTFSGRDSILNTLAQRLTLSNMLIRKPAPDNTTRESFS